MRRPGRALILVSATLAGVLVGWVVAQGRQRRHRADLFSPRPSRRAAALGYLAGQPGVGTIRLLEDYLRWEVRPALRRRAEGLLAKLEARLG